MIFRDKSHMLDFKGAANELRRIKGIFYDGRMQLFRTTGSCHSLWQEKNQLPRTLSLRVQVSDASKLSHMALP